MSRDSKSDMAMHAQSNALSRGIRLVMAFGIAVSVVLLIAGECFSYSGSANGSLVSFFGISVLIATPIVRVVMCLRHFSRERDWKYVALTMWVLIAMLAGVLLGAA